MPPALCLLHSPPSPPLPLQMTGSGKTHTVFGNASHEHEAGLVPRMLQSLFQRVAQANAYTTDAITSGTIDSSEGGIDTELQHDEASATGDSSSTEHTTWEVRVSMCEIYNEKIHDQHATLNHLQIIVIIIIK